MSPRNAVALAVIGYLAWQALACWIWPFAACWHCDGGKKRSPSGKAWRTCKRCKGTGARLRVGRVMWNAWYRVYSKGQ